MDAFPLPPPQFSGTPRKVGVLSAFEWIAQGWATFMVAPALWLSIGFGILIFWAAFEFMFAYTLINMDPSLLRRAVSAFFLFGPVLILPAISAGGVHVCRKIAAGETPQFSDLAWGAQHKTRALTGVGVLFLSGWLGLFAFYSLVTGPLALFLPTLAGFAFLMAIWFTPVLVAFHDMPVFSALRASFLACFSNLGAFSAFGLMMMVLHFLALLPLGLGLPLLLPVVVGTLHASYRDVFPES